MATTTVIGTFALTVSVVGNFDYDDPFMLDFSASGNILYYCILF